MDGCTTCVADSFLTFISLKEKNVLSEFGNSDGYTFIPGDIFSLIVVTSHLVHIPLMQYFPLDFTLAQTPVNTIHHLPLTLDIGTELI